MPSRACFAVPLGLVILWAGCAGESPRPTGSATESTSPHTSASTSQTSTVLSGLSWRSHAEAGTPRLEVAVAAVDGLVYAVGGFDEFGRATTTTEAYDTTTDRWESRADYLIPVHHAPAVALGGHLYVLGGYTPNTFTPTTVAARYDPAMNLWLPIAGLPEARGAHAAAVLVGKIYVVGGVGSGGMLSKSVHVYDPSMNAWSTAPEFPSPRDHLAAAELNGKLYVVGGRLQSLATNTGRVDVFDPVGGGWSKGADMPTQRGGIAATSYRGHVIVFGGEEGGSTFAQVEAYDSSADAWRSLPNMPHPRHGLGAATLGGRAYAVLGGPTSGLSASGTLDSLGP